MGATGQLGSLVVHGPREPALRAGLSDTMGLDRLKASVRTDRDTAEVAARLGVEDLRTVEQVLEETASPETVGYDEGSSRSGLSSSSTLTSLKVSTRTLRTNRAGRYMSQTQASESLSSK